LSLLSPGSLTELLGEIQLDLHHGPCGCCSRRSIRVGPFHVSCWSPFAGTSPTLCIVATQSPHCTYRSSSCCAPPQHTCVAPDRILDGSNSALLCDKTLIMSLP
jgi:hypothetical protein